jgi:hypothetical protein
MVSTPLHLTDSFIVSETEEELISDEEDKKYKKKKIFSLSQFSRLMNKKIYSDEFDMSFESKRMKKRFQIGSVVECPINEDIESEDQNNYLSDQSSSTFSFQKKRMSFDLTKIIDRLEPSIDFSYLMASKNYGVNISDTIKEEEDDEHMVDKKGILSLEMLSKLKSQH